MVLTNKTDPIMKGVNHMTFIKMLATIIGMMFLLAIVVAILPSKLIVFIIGGVLLGKLIYGKKKDS